MLLYAKQNKISATVLQSVTCEGKRRALGGHRGEKPIGSHDVTAGDFGRLDVATRSFGVVENIDEEQNENQEKNADEQADLVPAKRRATLTVQDRVPELKAVLEKVPVNLRVIGVEVNEGFRRLLVHGPMQGDVLRIVRISCKQTNGMTPHACRGIELTGLGEVRPVANELKAQFGFLVLVVDVHRVGHVRSVARAEVGNAPREVQLSEMTDHVRHAPKDIVQIEHRRIAVVVDIGRCRRLRA